MALTFSAGRRGAADGCRRAALKCVRAGSGECRRVGGTPEGPTRGLLQFVLMTKIETLQQFEVYGINMKGSEKRTIFC